MQFSATIWDKTARKQQATKAKNGIGSRLLTPGKWRLIFSRVTHTAYTHHTEDTHTDPMFKHGPIS